MTAAAKRTLISVEEYLTGELRSPVKHEYLGGIVYAMAGATNAHNRIADNIHGTLHGLLRGQPCKASTSDTKIRVRMAAHVRFYYPDVSVTCRPNPPGDSFNDDPAVIFEVLSQSTRRIDEGEKKDAYLTIPSLAAYALVESGRPEVVLFRRTDQGFLREVYEGTDAVIPLLEIAVALPLADVYEGVEFVPKQDEGP